MLFIFILYSRAISLPFEAATEVIRLNESHRLSRLDFKWSKSYWNNVAKIKDSDLCVCMLCGQKYKANPSNGKAVKHHMISHHRYVDNMSNKINNEVINRSLFEFLTYNGISSTVLDSVYFRRFCNNFNYNVPRRSDFNYYLEEESDSIIVLLFISYFILE